MQTIVTMLLALLLIGAGCSSKTTAPPTDAGGTSERVVGLAVPPGSPLVRVRPGMSKKEVRDLLGEASDENSYPTGKAFIPFYFGNDARRTSWYYKGVGRVVFADGNVFGGGGSEVVRVDHDPGESGTAPR